MPSAPSLHKIEVLSLANIQHLSRQLAGQIRAAHYRPDVVIAIARGGFVPARLLCDFLDIYNLTCIRIAHYTGTDIHEQARLSIPLNIDIRGMTVLLVDDVDDTGDTLQLALEHLESFAPATIRTAVLHHKNVSRIVPEYFAVEVREWRWITYPWAITEDILGLVRKINPPPATIDEAIACLKQEYGIHISKQTMGDVYCLLSRA